jgi:hypothetical protein
MAPPDAALPLGGEDSGFLLLASTTSSPPTSLTLSAFFCAFSSVVPSTAGSLGSLASFRRVGDVENFEDPEVAPDARGRKDEVFTAADICSRRDAPYNLLAFELRLIEVFVTLRSASRHGRFWP